MESDINVCTASYIACRYTDILILVYGFVWKKFLRKDFSESKIRKSEINIITYN